MYSTLGVPSGAIGWVYGPQSGTDWVTSTLIVPLNGLAITTPRSQSACAGPGFAAVRLRRRGHTPARSGRAPADDTGRRPGRFWLPREYGASPTPGEDRGAPRRLAAAAPGGTAHTGERGRSAVCRSAA